MNALKLIRGGLKVATALAVAAVLLTGPAVRAQAPSDPLGPPPERTAGTGRAAVGLTGARSGPAGNAGNSRLKVQPVTLRVRVLDGRV